MDMDKRADYGNWVPAAIMKVIRRNTVFLLIISILLLILINNKIFAVIGFILTAAMFVMCLYMGRCRKIFDFNGGNLMGKIHQFLVDRFPWSESRQKLGVNDGSGSIIDIGCGAAALTNRIAKTHPNATVTGIDYWGDEWSYAKEQCEKNAAIEGVSDRVSFQKGDAAKLDFEDETFDGAVSNFVFHEVKTAKDKRDVVKEALRVVKKGGAFAFQDMFGQRSLYGDMDAFLKELEESGTVSEIHYIANIENQDFVPKFVTAPWMIKNAGLIFGIR